MVEAGILEYEIPIAEASVADRYRQDYVFGLLVEVAYAVASRSANPAALVAGEEETYNHAERESRNGPRRAQPSSSSSWRRCS